MRYPNPNSRWLNNDFVKDYQKKYRDSRREQAGKKARIIDQRSKKCAHCEKDFLINFNSIIQITRKFCSRGCYILHQKSGAYVKDGTRMIGNGYVLIRKINHPHANKRGYVYEHRLVAEQNAKRILSPNEVVHHINGIKTDNRPENLKIFSSTNEHTTHHNLKGDLFGKKRKD